MPPRIVGGPAGETDRLRSILLSNPALLEEGIRILDADLAAGPHGLIDLVALGRDGALVLVTHAPGDPEIALPGLLDRHLWAEDEIALLSRLYAAAGLGPDPAVRSLILAPSFTAAFLRRLALFDAPVTPLLARAVPGRQDSEWLIEPAERVFGAPPPRARGTRPSVAVTVAPTVAAPGPDATAPVTAPIEQPEDEPLKIDEGWSLMDEVPLEPPRPFSFSEDEAATPGSGVVADRLAHDLLEPLTPEEIDAFERFDRDRRGRDRT